jgi:hypothetical protein
MVMATPHKIQKIFWDQIYYSIYRYPWRIGIQGAKPAQYQDHLTTTELAAGAAHSNGGGWVANTAQVAPSVYVAATAKVLERAKLSGQVRIEGQVKRKSATVPL